MSATTYTNRTALDAPLTDRAGVAWGLLALRIVFGIIMMMHGSQKVFGAFGGPGLAATMSTTPPAGMGPILGLLVPIGEFFGGLGIMVGVLTRFSAAANIIIMLGAIATVHGKNGFFLADKGYEYNLALIGMCLMVLIAGPGPFTALRLLLKKVPPAVE